MEPIPWALSLLLWAAPAGVEPATPLPEDLFHAARMRGYAGESAEALRDVRRFLDLYPGHPLGRDLALWAARHLERQGRPEEARALLDWLESGPVARVHEGEAILLWVKTAPGGEEPVPGRGLADVPPEDPLAGRDALSLLLDGAREAGRLDGPALDRLREFLRLYPDDRRAGDYAGWAWDELLATGRVEEARQLHQVMSARGIFPGDAAWSELTDLAMQAESNALDGILARAAGILEQLPPGPRRSLLAREMAHRLAESGALLALVGRLGTLAARGGVEAEGFGALVELAEAAAAGPEASSGVRESLPLRDLHHLVLVAHARTGNIAELRRWLDQTLERWPQDPAAYELGAALLAWSGETAESRRVLLQGVRAVRDEQKREAFEAVIEGIRPATGLAPLEFLQ